MKNFTGYLAFIILIMVGLACSGDETQKANELVKEANKFIMQATEDAKKADEKGNEYDTKLAKITNDNQLEELRNLGKEVMKNYDSINESFTKASSKFDEASKLKINEKFKEYLEIKAKEMKKRSEYFLEIKKIPQALIDSKSKQEYLSESAKIGTSAKKMIDEAKDLAEKGDKIVKDNPSVIKPME